MDKSGKISIFHFSGTGNTKWVAEKTSEKLSLKGFEANAYSIEKLNPKDIFPDDFEQVGIMFPVYSSTAPPPMIEFLKELPKANGTPVFAVACAWLFGGHTAYDYTNQLSEKGYKPYLFANVLMPNNINLPPFGWIPIKNDKQIKPKLIKAERKIEKLITKIINLEPYEEGNGWLSRRSDNAQRKGADNDDMINFLC
ncbi:MAG: EFR1 family ferrodoxin [Caldisericia bacterium]